MRRGILSIGQSGHPPDRSPLSAKSKLRREFVDLTCRSMLAPRAMIWRKGPIETATLAILQSHLLSEAHARIFVEEFRRESEKLSRQTENRDEDGAARLRQLEAELVNLTQNLLAGLASPTLMNMISDRESEKARLEGQHGTKTTPRRAEILSPAALRERFAGKVAALRASLNADAVRTESAAVLATLIESVTIYPDGAQGAEAEIVAKVEDLMTFATNENAAPKGGVSSSVTVVAGAGFEPATFRL